MLCLIANHSKICPGSKIPFLENNGTTTAEGSGGFQGFPGSQETTHQSLNTLRFISLAVLFWGSSS